MLAQPLQRAQQHFLLTGSAPASCWKRSTVRVRVGLTCYAGKPQQRRKARRPGLFEVLVVTPPKQSLGIHALPPETHNGDQIQVDGKDFVVSSLVLQYKLVGGRYEREHNRLDVQELSRYFLNMHLDSLMQRPARTQ